MAAIALMAFALFSCNNKKNEPKCEDAVLKIRINDAELRNLEAPVEAGTVTECLTDVVLTMDNGKTITLDGTKLTAAKGAGYTEEINYVVNTVALTANATVSETTEIKDLQKADLTKVALEAPATAVETSTDGDKTVYTVTLEPKPVVARLEIGGKIEPVKNKTTNKSAFESIVVEHVYINNYLPTRAGDRHMSVSNGKDGFDLTAGKPALVDEMHDAITDQTKFESKELIAGYQLFPKKEDETATKPDYFDHVVLKIKITYTAEALAADKTLEQKTDRYVTIARFMKDATGDLDAKGFEAGVIYKLDLKELNGAFKTTDEGTPDPNNPDTPDPEPNQKKELVVKVKPYKWTAQNIKPDVNDGYKK